MFMSDVVVATALAHILVLRACADMHRAHVLAFGSSQKRTVVAIALAVAVLAAVTATATVSARLPWVAVLLLVLACCGGDGVDGGSSEFRAQHSYLFIGHTERVPCRCASTTPPACGSGHGRLRPTLAEKGGAVGTYVGTAPASARSAVGGCSGKLVDFPRPRWHVSWRTVFER